MVPKAVPGTVRSLTSEPAAVIHNILRVVRRAVQQRQQTAAGRYSALWGKERAAFSMAERMALRTA
jgi:hypothetical protein